MPALFWLLVVRCRGWPVATPVPAFLAFVTVACFCCRPIGETLHGFELLIARPRWRSWPT
ncbi:MAG: hypothetical protein R2991_02325 [Thermoanaerobaculia bacterium]